MQLLVSRGLLINPTQEFQPLLVAMPIHAGADNFSIRDIECGEQRGRTVALIIVSPRFTSPFLHRKSWLRSIQSLNLALLIDERTRACSGGFRYNPTISSSLSMNCGSLLSLKVFTTCGFKPCLCQMRRTVASLMDTARAEEHTSELQSRLHLVCRLLLEKKNKKTK